jgi:tetratricopeptide (TPR) repeat protein
MKRAVTIAGALCAIFMFFPPTGLAQSQEAGIRIFNQAKTLMEKARTRADMEKAVEKYEQAIRIFISIGEAQNQGNTLNNLGAVYYGWGQYPKAAEFYEKALEIRREIGDVKGESDALNNLGNVYSDWEGQNAKAVEYYEKSLKIRKKIGDIRGQGEILNNLGEVYRNWGQYPKAVESYEASLDIARKTGNVKGEGLTLNNLGLVYYGWGQYSKAVELYEKALRIFQRVGYEEGSGAVANNLGIVYSEWRSQNAKAVEYYEKSLKIRKKIGDIRGEGQTLMNLGHVYAASGQNVKAVEYYEKSLGIFRKIGDVADEGKSLMGLGDVYYALGQRPKTLEYYEKSLEISRKIGEVKGEGQTLRALGVAHKAWGQYAEALEYGKKSLEISRKIGDVKGEGETLVALGRVYAAWDQYAKAVEYYEKSLEISRKIEDSAGEGNTLTDLGFVYADWGQYTKAVKIFEKSLNIRRKVGDVPGEGETLIALGEVYRNWDHYDKALASFQQGQEIYVKVGVPTDLPEDSIGNLYLDKGEIEKAEPFIRHANRGSSLGRLYLAKTDFPSAKNSYESLLKSAEQNRDADNLFTAYAGLGMSYEGMGDNPQAVEYYRKAVLYTEDLRSSLNIAERQTFFDVRINGFYRTAPYEGLARAFAKMNRPVEAFKESEYTRARIFAESISKRNASSGLDVPTDVRDKDSQLADELAALTKNLQKAYEKQNKEQIAVLEPQLKEAQSRLASHVDMLRKQYPLFAATKYPQPMDLSQTGLNDDEWVLAYHVTDTGVIIYLTKGKTLVKGSFKPIARKEVDELVRKFHEPMEVGSGETVAQKLGKFDFASGKKLSDLLLADILPDLPKDASVIVVPDGSLGVLPLEMLVLSDGGKVVTENQRVKTSGTEFFGDRNPISYYQSITALTLARTLGKHQKAGEKTLAMVDPVFSADDPRLIKVAKQERDKLLANLPTDLTMSIQTESGLTFPRLPLTAQLGESLKSDAPQQIDLYEGLNVKKNVLLNKDLTVYKSLVFATHGYFGKDLPGIQEPVLVMSLLDQPKGQDGFLRLSEVMGLKLNCDIAALTACQTGLGRHISGEGTMGMGRAFQYAGAKSVLMSLWSVSETASVNLVESFFKHLKEGKTKLESLRLARDEIRKVGYDHPFYWAPFILVGEVD